MRTPIYRARPVEPNPARFGGVRYNDSVLISEAFSNAYRIETDEGSVQINAGMGMEAPVIESNFATHSAKPVHSLVLTQGHVDHVGGVQYFRDRNPGLRVIAGANNPEHQAYDARLAAFRANRSAFAFADKFAEVFAYYAEQGHNEFPQQDTPIADVLVEQRLHFALGGIDFEVIAVPGAETNDSVIVWLPQQRYCFTGNLFGCPFGHFPNLVTIRGDRYRDPLVVARAVDLVRILQPKVIFYGHHAPVEGEDIIALELEALHGAIHYVHDAVVDGMNAGKTVHELMAAIELPAEFEVGQGYGKVSWGVRSIWEYYAGWFHHRSTTELYSVPSASVAADLVEMAGAEALLACAEQKFREGRCEEALHLLDVLRDGNAFSDGARKLAVDVHRALLEESDNFWLSSWLKQQIKEQQIKEQQQE